MEEEIKAILDLGIELRCNQMIGVDKDLEALRKEGFDAVFLGVGAQHSRRIFFEGSDLPDVLQGIDFLGRVAAGEHVNLNSRVIVLGGGSVAVDAAMTARRCGAREVTIVCLESRGEMAAHERELEWALAEGVRLMPSWGPHRIVSRGGRVTGIELVRCTSVLDDGDVFCPAFGQEKAFIGGDQVIMAIGQTPDLALLEGVEGISLNRGLIVVHQETLETGCKGVYAGGDAVAGQGAIIHAIAAGRKAAASIDRALGGRAEIDEVLFERPAPDPCIGRDEGFAGRWRVAMAERSPAARQTGFAEIALGLGPEQAVQEARRCLNCDLRLLMRRNASPPADLQKFDAGNIEQAPGTEGVYRLYDQGRNMLAIKGATNLKRSLLAELDKQEAAEWFDFEETKMYTQRESEMIQQYLQQHGKMPGSGAPDLDDLF